MRDSQCFFYIFNSMRKYFNRVIITIFLGLGAVVMGVFLLWPMVQEFSRVERELEQYTVALSGKEKYVSKLAMLAQQLDTKKEAIQKIETAIPDNTSIPALFDLLQKMGISSGLVVTEIGTSVKEDDPIESNLVTTTVSLQAIGSYNTLKTFIAQAKSSAQLLEITSISFGGGGAGELPGQEQFGFTLELETYSD